MRSLPLLLLVAAACSRGGSGGAAQMAARVAMLAGLGPTVIVPTYERLAERTVALRDALAALRANPTPATLAAAQDAWRDARAAWNRGEAFLFGPPSDLFLASKVDVSPVDEARIEAEIAGTAVLDEAHIESLGSTRKGFFAVEYLIFDEVGGDAAVLAALSESARRRDYLLALGDNLAAVAARIRDIWSRAGEGFVDDFVEAGAPDSAFPSSKAAEDAIMNHLLVLIEIIADVRLGRPIGKTAGGLDQPLGAESDRSGNSRADVLDDLRGIRNLYEGTFEGASTNGLSSVVAAQTEVIDDVFRRSLNDLVAAVEAIPGPLEDADPALVETAFDRAKELKKRLLVDLVAALNTTLTFSPFDGD